MIRRNDVVAASALTDKVFKCGGRSNDRLGLMTKKFKAALWNWFLMTAVFVALGCKVTDSSGTDSDLDDDGGGASSYSFDLLNLVGNQIGFLNGWTHGSLYATTDFSTACSGGYCQEVGGEWIASGVNICTLNHSYDEKTFPALSAATSSTLKVRFSPELFSISRGSKFWISLGNKSQIAELLFVASTNTLRLSEIGAGGTTSTSFSLTPYSYYDFWIRIDDNQIRAFVNGQSVGTLNKTRIGNANSGRVTIGTSSDPTTNQDLNRCHVTDRTHVRITEISLADEAFNPDQI